ncbi:hypothetical protein MFP25_13785 [Brenneria sp. Ex1a]|nr:hypothetical protein [Brenneria tiliae]
MVDKLPLFLIFSTPAEQKRDIDRKKTFCLHILFFFAEKSDREHIIVQRDDASAYRLHGAEHGQLRNKAWQKPQIDRFFA